MDTGPKTLQEAIIFFENPDNCIAYLVARRWPNGVACPKCGRVDVSYIPKHLVYQSRKPVELFRLFRFSLHASNVTSTSSIPPNAFSAYGWASIACMT